jgi:hypothetical protein
VGGVHGLAGVDDEPSFDESCVDLGNNTRLDTIVQLLWRHAALSVIADAPRRGHEPIELARTNGTRRIFS